MDWFCLPRFDSAACFAALLGGPEHGRWLIAPSDEPTSITRRYLPETLVLETVFRTETGAVRLVDFMPPGRDDTVLARIVEGLEGEVEVSTELVLRFEYGSAVPWHRVVSGSGRLVPGHEREARRRLIAEGVTFRGAHVPMAQHAWWPEDA